MPLYTGKDVLDSLVPYQVEVQRQIKLADIIEKPTLNEVLCLAYALINENSNFVRPF